jgi:hypothetical protein
MVDKKFACRRSLEGTLVSWWRSGALEPVWQTIVSEPAPLAELVIEGNGKDLGLEVALAGGRRLQMGAAEVAVFSDGAVAMRLERIGDRSLKIRYAGPGLEIRSMQVRFPDPDWQEEFIADTSAFLADGDELNYCVDAKIVLAVLPDPPDSPGQ